MPVRTECRLGLQTTSSGSKLQLEPGLWAGNLGAPKQDRRGEHVRRSARDLGTVGKRGRDPVGGGGGGKELYAMFWHSTTVAHCGPPTAYGKEGPAPEATPGADYFGCHKSVEGVQGGRKGGGGRQEQSSRTSDYEIYNTRTRKHDIHGKRSQNGGEGRGFGRPKTVLSFQITIATPGNNLVG